MKFASATNSCASKLKRFDMQYMEYQKYMPSSHVTTYLGWVFFINGMFVKPPINPPGAKTEIFRAN